MLFRSGVAADGVSRVIKKKCLVACFRNRGESAQHRRYNIEHPLPVHACVLLWAFTDRTHVKAGATGWGLVCKWKDSRKKLRALGVQGRSVRHDCFGVQGRCTKCREVSGSECCSSLGEVHGSSGAGSGVRRGIKLYPLAHLL